MEIRAHHRSERVVPERLTDTAPAFARWEREKRSLRAGCVDVPVRDYRHDRSIVMNVAAVEQPLNAVTGQLFVAAHRQVLLARGGTLCDSRS